VDEDDEVEEEDDVDEDDELVELAADEELPLEEAVLELVVELLLSSLPPPNHPVTASSTKKTQYKARIPGSMLFRFGAFDVIENGLTRLPPYGG